MTRDAAKKFWIDHIRLACAGGTHLLMPNPADSFTTQAYMGKFDEISDKEYEEMLKDTSEIASFWNHNHTETVGNLLKTALSRTNIYNKDVARLAGILANCSVRSNYDTEGQNKKSLDENHFSPDGRDITMDITPEQLVKQLQKTVVGQDKYIQDICTAVWMHNLRYDHFTRTGEIISHPKHNVLCLGQSGTGKTLAIQTLGKILDIPVLIEDASSLRGSGWRGNSVSSMVPRILELSGNNENRAKFAIVCLDEFDKVFQCQVTDKSFSPVSNLLTFMGGALITHSESNNNASMDTSNLLFICLGAFDGLKEIIQKRLSGGSGIGFGSDGYREVPEKDIFQLATKDDLSQYGIPWEMLGRISLITTTNDLSIEDFKKILMDSEMSPVKQYDNLLYNSIHAHVSISDAAASHISQIAHDSHMGAREMGRIVSEALMPAIYSIGNDNSIAGVTLDVGQDGFFVSYQMDIRPVPSPEQNADNQDDIPDLLTEIDMDVLQSVPFCCKTDQDSIINYTTNIYDASENVKWRPISQIHPKPLLASAMCILTASICTLLMDTENQNHTIYDLVNAADRISPAMVAHDTSVQPLNLMRREFMDKALENPVNFSKATEIAKHLIRQYAHRYSYEAKYNGI